MDTRYAPGPDDLSGFAPEAELSDDDLEAVVGGLSRVLLPAEAVPAPLAA